MERTDRSALEVAARIGERQRGFGIEPWCALDQHRLRRIGGVAKIGERKLHQVKQRSGGGTNLRPISTQSCACWSRVSASISTGVWLTTVSKALWLHTSHSSGATLKSPTMIVGSVSVSDQRVMRSMK